MTATGYSGTSLAKKLGIKPGMKILLINPPENYTELLETDISGQYDSGKATADFIHLFATDDATFVKGMKTVLLISRKNTSAITWVSWYKKASGMATDLSENRIREFALQNGLVDIKVCAVSNEWSGLKLVVPLAKR